MVPFVLMIRLQGIYPVFQNTGVEDLQWRYGVLQELPCP